jgi:hypothetical protein
MPAMLPLDSTPYPPVTLVTLGNATQPEMILFALSCGLYYKTIKIVIMMLVSDATIWSITYGHN